MKGIILAGGSGTRLYPNTNIISKQLLPVFDKPMIYYPLSTLMLAGIKQIGIISTPSDLPLFKKLLGNGGNLGIEIEYFEQTEPKGIADAFIVCKNFIGKDSVTLILGDNIFYGNLRVKEVLDNFENGAVIFGYPVTDQERYGILEFDKGGNVVNIHEKPKNPMSRYAIPGLYIYDNSVIGISENLKPSSRGELEITDVNRQFLNANNLKVQILGRGIAWLDTGTSDSLHEASNFVYSIEKRQSYKIGCLEEISLREEFISLENFSEIISNLPTCEYRSYLEDIRNEFEQNQGNKEKGIRALQK